MYEYAWITNISISFANEAMPMTSAYQRPTLSADFRFYDVVCYSAYSREMDSSRSLTAVTGSGRSTSWVSRLKKTR